MARHNLIRLVALLTFAALALLDPKHTSAEQPPRVFAFYYAWFDEQTWTPDHAADIPAEPYVSRDPGAMARHIDQANGAGIDSFVVSWLGPGNPTDERFRLLLDIAAGKGFSAAIDFEANRFASRDALIGALVHVRDQLMPHGAYSRVNGKPVLFFWREQVRNVDDWQEIRNQVDPNHDQIWIAEGVNIDYQRVFDGHHLYSIAWSPDVDHTLSDWSRRVRRAGADKLWVATVMPGYDDTRTDRADRFARDRRNGDYYRETWNAAIATRPDMVVITSFNEWVEGSMIEPSVTYGNLYLDLTREFAARFKSSAPPSREEKIALAAPPTPRHTPPPTQAPNAPPTLAPTRGPSPTPTPTPVAFAAFRTTGVLRVRSGPGTEYDIVDRVPENFVLDVLGRSADHAWLAIAYPDLGSLGWVSAEFVTPRDGLDQFPVEFVPAPESATRSPTSSPGDQDAEQLPSWY